MRELDRSERTEMQTQEAKLDLLLVGPEPETRDLPEPLGLLETPVTASLRFPFICMWSFS